METLIDGEVNWVSHYTSIDGVLSKEDEGYFVYCKGLLHEGRIACQMPPVSTVRHSIGKRVRVFGLLTGKRSMHVTELRVLPPANARSVDEILAMLRN